MFLGAKIKLDKGIGYKYLFVPGIGLKSLTRPGSLELGKIADNWVLLYHAIPGDFPILVAFNKKPELIEWGSAKNSALAGMDYIRFCFTTSEFITYIGLLEGAALVNTEAWRNEIPEERLKKATILAHEILAFPVDLSEEALADWEQKTVRITRKYHFSTVPNEFGIKPWGLAACPPYVFYPHARGKLCSPELLDIYTLYGLANYIGGDTVIYELPIDSCAYVEVDMPNIEDMQSPLEKEIQRRINAEANYLMDIWRKVPADDNPYKFCGIAQQLLTCYLLLDKSTQKRALDWVKKTLEWYFTADHPSGRKYYYLDENFDFYYLCGHYEPHDIDCLLGMVFACTGEYVRYSQDIDFVKKYYPRYYRMFDSYFNHVIDPMTGNAFAQPDGKLNWVSDTLETYIGLNYIVRHARMLGKREWVNAAKINAIFRCAAIGQLYGWQIAQSIPGFKEYNLDPTYDLYGVRCVHICDGWWPLIHRTKESEAFWDMVASLWPISPEICILYQDIRYSQGLDKLFKAYQHYWPQWYRYGKKWKGAKGKQNVGGGFRANALIALLAFFKLKSQKTLYKWYRSANPDQKMDDKFQWDGWKEFPLAMILRMGKR